MSRRRRVGIAAIAVGVAGAAAGGVIAAERRAVGRAHQRPDPYVDEPLGHLHTKGVEVVADDGLPLHVEVDGDDRAGVTVVFVHGFTLSMDCFHFQRRDLGDVGRLVFYDARSHGASGRSAEQRCTIDQLGKDLHTVLEAVVPTGPVVLVGHSMGGMTILALADQHPELFGSRIVGVGLMSTSTGEIAKSLFGLPGWAARVTEPLVPRVARLAHQRATLLERGRLAGSDFGFLATRAISYGPDVSPTLVRFMEQMIEGTPIAVMTEFFDTFLSHDKLKALDVLRDVPVLISCGDRDVLTPLAHSEVMAAALPSAELQVVSDGGHMAIIEHHVAVNSALRRLVERAVEGASARAAG